MRIDSQCLFGPVAVLAFALCLLNPSPAQSQPNAERPQPNWGSISPDRKRRRNFPSWTSFGYHGRGSVSGKERVGARGRT